MDYWTLKKKAIMGSMQSGKVAEAEGYPLKLENAIKGNMKDYKIWGNKKGNNLLDIPYLNMSTTSKTYVDYRSVPLFKLQPSTTYYYSFEYVINSSTDKLGTSVGRGDRMYRSDIVYREVWSVQTIGKRAKFTMSFTTPDSFVRPDGQVWDNLFFRVRSYGTEFDVDTYNHMLTTIPDYYEYKPYQENDGLGAHIIENLFDIGTIDDWENGTNASLTIADGVITGYVEAGAGHYFFKNTYYPSGTYSVFIEERTNNTDAIFIIRLYDADGNELTANAGYSVSGNFVWNSYYKGFTKSANYGTYFTIPKSVSSWKLGFAVNGTAGTKATLSKIMLAEGDKCVKYRKNNYIDIVSRSKNWLKATDFYSFCGSNYSTLIEDGRNCVRFIDDGRKYANAHLTFRPNTRYTVSFDCKTVKKSSNNTNGSCVFRFVYDDGSNSSIYVEQNADWRHRTLSSIAGKTVAYIGLVSYNYTNWCYIDIDTFQLEEGTATPYEPYIEPITTTIDLTGHNSIMPNEYIDFKNGCIVRNDGTEEDIILPKIPLHKGYNILTASDAELEATKMYGKYLKKG